MKRAYSLVTIITKGTDDARVIEGTASTPSPDRVGDIVVPSGAKFALPLPLLWQHDHSQPIGTVEWAEVTPEGIRFRARLAHPDTAKSPTLKDRLQEAWDSIKLGLTRAVSIGFRPLEHSYIDGGGVRFSEWEWMELSVVTIPANSEATIAAAKFYSTHGGGALPTSFEHRWQKAVDAALADRQKHQDEFLRIYPKEPGAAGAYAYAATVKAMLYIMAEQISGDLGARLAAVEDILTAPPENSQ